MRMEGDVADAIRREWSGATIVQRGEAIIGFVRSVVEISDAVIERAGRRPAAILLGRVPSQRAVVERRWIELFIVTFPIEPGSCIGTCSLRFGTFGRSGADQRLRFLL